MDALGLAPYAEVEAEAYPECKLQVLHGSNTISIRTGNKLPTTFSSLISFVFRLIAQSTSSYSTPIA